MYPQPQQPRLLSAAMQSPWGAREWVSVSWSPGRDAFGPVPHQASWPSHCWLPRPCQPPQLLLSYWWTLGVPQPPERSWGSELGQEADLPEISQGLGLLSLPHSQSLGLFLPDAIPHWVMSTPLDGYPPRSPSCLSSLG